MKNLFKRTAIALSICGLLGTSIAVFPQETSAFSLSKDQREREASLKRTQQIVKYHENATEVKTFMVKLQKLKKQGKLATNSDAYTLVSYLQNFAPYADINLMDKFDVVGNLSYHNIIRKKQLKSVVATLEPAVQLAYNWTGTSAKSIAKKKAEQLLKFTLTAGKAAKKGNSFTYNDIKNIKM